MKEQVAELPLRSVAVLVTVVVPTLNVLPDTGFDTTEETVQLSVAVAEKVTTALQLPVEAFWVIADGQVTTGFWLSTTVTVNEQVAELPLRSVAILVTVVVPMLNVLPETGFDTIEETVQLSVAVAEKVTTALQLPLEAFCVIAEGQVTTGLWLSTTVTVDEQVAVLPMPSVAFHTFVVVPTGKLDPEANPDNIETVGDADHVIVTCPLPPNPPGRAAAPPPV